MEWIIGILALLILALLSKIKFKQSNVDYRLKGPLFSPAERSFYGVLSQSTNDKFLVFGKVRVADVISPEKGLNRSQWQQAFNKISSKHFDYVLYDKQTLKVVAAVELDDKSHNTKKSQKRDAFLESACQQAKLPLLRFPAKKSYQVQLITDQINQALSIEEPEKTDSLTQLKES